MCLIMYHPAHKDGQIPYEHFERAASNNPDGMGLMYVEDGVLKVVRRLNGVGKLYRKYLHARSVGSPVVVHFRLATSGEDGCSNVHPFFLSPDLAFCHNGVLTGYSYHKDYRNDTRIFADEVLRHLPTNWWKNSTICYLVESYIGTDKMVFLDASGYVRLLNPTQGYWIDGIWYSNRSHTYTYSKWWDWKTWDKDTKSWVSHTSLIDDNGGTDSGKVVRLLPVGSGTSLDPDDTTWFEEDENVDHGESVLFPPVNWKEWHHHYPIWFRGRIFCVECVPKEGWDNKDELREFETDAGWTHCVVCETILATHPDAIGL